MDDMRDGDTVFEEDLEVGIFWRWFVRASFLIPLIVVAPAVAHSLANPQPTDEGITEIHWAGLTSIVILLAVLTVLFWTIRLRLMVDDAGVAIRFCAFPPRRIPFSEIHDVSVGRDSFLRVGYGLDPIFTRSISYGVNATHKVTLRCRNGWRIHVSTHRADAFQEALAAGRGRS